MTSARLRSQPLRVGLLLTGTAVAFAMFVAVLGGSLLARQQSLHRALSALPESERGFRVDRFGVTLDQRAYDAADRHARRALSAFGGGTPRRVIVFRELRIGGELVEVAAADGLPQLVALRSGRLPQSCTSRECEVLRIGRGGRVRLAGGGVRLHVVGTARLRDAALFGDVSAATGDSAAPPTLLLARDLRALQALPALQPFYRVYSWVSPLRVARLQTWDVSSVLAEESRTQALLASDPNFRLGGPDAALLDAQRRGRTAARRLLLVGGGTSALLLGFAVIAAVGLRRGLNSERRRLFTRGARRWQVALASVAEIAAVTTAAALVGVAAGAVVTAVIAASADLPVAASVGHAIGGRTPVVALLLAWAVTTAVLVLTAIAPERSDGRRIRVIDVAAVGAAATAAVAIGRGALDPESASSGDTLLFLALPTLVAFVAAVVLARIVPPAMRAAERPARRLSVNLRLAVLALARAPARTIVSCAFIAVALGLALFAAAYRATLDRGAADQAAFDVPLDLSVGIGPSLTQPLESSPLATYRKLPGVADAYPVVRLTATTPGPGTSVFSPTVLGVPARAIARLRWRSDFSAAAPSTLAKRVSPQRTLRPVGFALPDGTRRIRVDARSTGADVDVGLIVDRASGRLAVVPMGRLESGAQKLSARLPRGARHVFGLQLTLPPGEQFFLAHRETEGRVNAAPAGSIELGPLKLVADWRGWTFASGGRVRHTATATRVDFAFQETGGSLVFRPREPTDGRPIPVVVSPDIAAVVGHGARLTLDLQDATLTARIVGVATRMPTVPSESGPFVLADEEWLSTAIDTNAPGRGTPDEIWIAANDGDAAAAALQRPPYTKLDVRARSQIQRQLEADPLAHATAIVLASAAIVSLILAVVGFWIALASELRDERSDFFDLEAQGVRPDGLRAQLRARAGIVVGIAVAAGVAIGAVLSQLAVSIVRISATADVPEPPLVLDPAWVLAGLAVLALGVAAWIVLEGTAFAAFRSARPERASWSLE